MEAFAPPATAPPSSCTHGVTKLRSTSKTIGTATSSPTSTPQTGSGTQPRARGVPGTSGTGSQATRPQATKFLLLEPATPDAEAPVPELTAWASLSPREPGSPRPAAEHREEPRG